MASVRKLASQTLWYGLSSVIGRMANFLMVPVYVNQFVKLEYGIISTLLAYTSIFLVIITFGMETAFFRFAESKETSGKAYTQSFLVVLFLSLLFGLIFGSGYDALSKALGYHQYAGMILMLIGTIVLDTISMVPMAKLRYDEKPGKYALISLASIILNILFNLIFIFVFKWGLASVFYAYFFASLIKAMMALYKNLPESWKPDVIQMKEMLSFGVMIMIAGLAGTLNENLDKIMIGLLWPDGALYRGVAMLADEMTGEYAANYKLAMFISLITQAFRYAAEPFFFKNADMKDAHSVFARVFHYFITVCLIVFLLISSFSHEIVSFTFFGLSSKTLIPKAYWPGLSIVPVVLMANVFLGAYFNLSIWFKLTKQPRFGVLISAIGAVITILVNLITIPWFGYAGSAWATLLCYFTMAAICFKLGQIYYPIPYRLERLIIYFLIALLLLQILDANAPHVGFKLFVNAAFIGGIFLMERIKPLRFVFRIPE
jgi:O-antigen/teichoic acid export membrane protein